MKRWSVLWVAGSFLHAVAGAWLAAAPVLNEVLYRPGSGFPENTALEFIELHNPDPLPVDLGGWAITSGADFTFPAGAMLEPGGYLVVSPNPAAFRAANPGVAQVFGPWKAGATLSNKGEKITLKDAGGGVVDAVTYADEGDWAVRTRDTLGGWSWVTGANGVGKSMERRTSAVVVDNGQLWAESTTPGGTPGAVNSQTAPNLPPVILQVVHSPAVPRSTDAVTISCRLADEAALGGLAATLHYRNATATTAGAFQSLPMAANEIGAFTAVLPAQPDKTIIEFYVSATDGTLTRTWPAPTSEGQNANCQYQVDNEVIAGVAPAYRLILTAAENAAFAAVPSTSNRQFNVTLIASKGDQQIIRYRASMRIRGMTSRNWGVRPVRISLPTDSLWDGVSDFNINSKIPYSQFIGMRCLQWAGLAACDASPLEVRRNGVKYSVTGANTDFGKLVRMEELNGDFIDNHWPNAPSGQLYRAELMNGAFWLSTGAAPANPDTAWNGWTKQNRGDANDWSDVMNFSTVWQSTCAPYFIGATPGNVAAGTWNNTAFSNADITTLEAVCDFDHLARYMAVATIIQNNEPNVTTGGTDDYAAAWIEDDLGRKRLFLVPHDLDNVLGKGDTPGTYNGTGLYNMTETGSIFEPLLPLFGNSSVVGNPAFRAKYLMEIRKLYGGLFDADTTGNPNPPFHRFLENHLSGWVDATVLNQMKTFATQRQAYLLGLIGQPKIVPQINLVGSAAATGAGSVRISEVLVANAGVYGNGTTFPDVIELHNASTSPVDVSGMSLTDDPAMPLKFVIPDGTFIPGNGHLVIHADSAISAPGLHSLFQLDALGESVHLYQAAAAGGALIDAVAFGPQIVDLSISRTAADPTVWALTVPTIGRENGAGLPVASPAEARINEWAGNTRHRLNKDFIELYNKAAIPVALGDVALTDDYANAPSLRMFPPLSFIGSNGILLLDEDDLGFKLDGDFGFVTLLAGNREIIDQVSIVSQFGDRSSGRSADGSETYAQFEIPSPGLSNSTPVPPAFNGLLSSLRITEIMAAPTGGGAYEFIELQNIGGAALDLSGVRFTNGVDYTFGEGVSLLPGAMTVVCRDRNAFLARHPQAAGVLASGSFTGALDNSGETLRLTLPAPWDVHVLNFFFDPGWFSATSSSGDSLTTVNAATSLIKDWEVSSTWVPSGSGVGTPGSDGPPVITSAAAGMAVVGDFFNYQITATKNPTVYQAEGLPDGLSIDPATGLISGTTVAAGSYAISLRATNVGGSGTAALVLNVGLSGPVNHYAWDWLAGDKRAGEPFAVAVTARDSAGRVVTSHQGTAAISARTGTPLGSPLVISEFTDGQQDQFELQNVSGAVVDAAGWYVRINDDTNGIHLVNPTQRTLPNSIPAGGRVWVSEVNTAPRLFWGGAINWSSTGLSKGWILLFDNTHKVRDFVVWGWTVAELAGWNVTINGTVVTPAGNWSGAAAAIGTRGTTNSWQRVGASDTNRATDFQWTTNASTFNTLNPNLTVPWESSQAVTVSPVLAAFEEGRFVSYLRFPAAGAAVVLTMDDGVGRSGSSAPFTVGSAAPDVDEDGLPDAWESANGLVVGVDDAAADGDGDGQGNLAEFRMGTDPRDGMSRFGIGGIVPAEGGLGLRWQGMAGQIYRVTGSEDLSGPWTAVQPLILATEDGPLGVTVPWAGQRRFFRIESGD